MFRKPPLKTYNRRNNGKINFSVNQTQSTINFNLMETKKTKEKNFNDTLEDPFDTTFDRLLKDAQARPPPPPNPGLSYISSSSEISDDTSTPKILTPDSEDSVFEWKPIVPKNKSKLKKQNSKPEKTKKKAAKPKSVKENSGVEPQKKKASKIATKTITSKKKTDPQKIKLTAKRKRRRISSGSETSLTDFVLPKKKSILQSSSKDDPCVHSNSISEVFTIPQTPVSINSSPKNTEDNNGLKNVDKVQSISVARKSEGKSIEFSPSKESFRSRESFPFKRSSYSSKTDSVLSSKIRSFASLKACSVVLERYDWMLKKKELMLKLKPCSIQIPRLYMTSSREANESSIRQNIEKETKRNSENDPVKEPEEELEKNPDKEQGNESRKHDSLVKETSSKKSVNRKFQVSGSPLAVKNCVVSLTRINPPKTSFLGRLVSSTPVIKRTNENLLSGGFSPMTLEISNITSPPDFNEILLPPIESSIIPRKLSEPSMQLEDINKSKNNNFKRNLTPKPAEFNSEVWNYSSDYSEIDWTTISNNGSQFEDEASTQEKRRTSSLRKQINELKSISVESSKKDLSASKDLSATNDLSISKNLDALTKPFNFVTRRNLNLNPEYEKSTSMFDDTKISEVDFRKLSPLTVDEKNLKKSPLKNLSPLNEKPSFTNSSILNQTDFKGFENQVISMPYMKKLSPMTSIPTSIVHSLSFVDSEKNISLVNELKLESEKCKPLQSLAFEKSIRYSGLKSPRRCLSFEGESKISLKNGSSDSISSNKESFNKESISKGSFHKESFVESLSQDSLNKSSLNQDSFNKNTLSQESIIEEDNTLDSEWKINNKVGLKDLSISSSFNINTLRQEFSSRNYLTQESIIEKDNSLDSERKINSKLGFEDFTISSSNKTEDSQYFERSESILLEDGKKSVNMKDESQHSLEDESQNSEEGDDSQNLEEDDSQKTIKCDSQKILENEIEEQIPETKAVISSEVKVRESILSLNQLKDPIRITHQRKKYRNWGLQLSAITENESRRSSETEVEISPQVKDVKVDPVQEDSPSIYDTVSLASNDSLTNFKDVEVPEQHLFLKPGKSWARSLSILNNIHSKDDVDKLSVGKGKKWRNSVITILDMQSKGIVQSCVRQQEGSKSPQSCGVLNENADYDSKFERLSTFGSSSPNRMVKRISIRVVPDAKKLDSVEDTQFLEAYGIISNQYTKILSQKFSSLQENIFVGEPQESLIYNVQLEKSVIKTSNSLPLITAKDVVLERCRQEDYLPFNQCYPEKFLQHCRKIGEGVYGEVFLYENGSDNSVIKIIPIEGNELVNGEPQKKFHEILSEIVIAKELHDLRFNEMYNTSGFVAVKSIKCIIGRYPPKLIELWKSFDDEKKSENDCPSMFDENQLYISLELGHGGQDLEAFVFQNANESYAVFIQAAFALAVAEQSLEFEHRDLHWGNVLISRTRKSEVSYKLGNREINFASSGVKVAIIDFTLSRMSYQGCCIFNDLALDPALFTAEGEYQFEIYRLMKDKIDNNWQKFEPFTNILWLHYTLDKMIKLVRYKKKTTKVHKAAIERLKELKDEILSYESAFDLVTKCEKLTSLYGGQNSSVASVQEDVDGAKKSL